MAKVKNNPDTIFQSLQGNKKKRKEKGSGTKKYERNRVKCAKYRSRVGKPNGRGVPGNKRGKNKTK